MAQLRSSSSNHGGLHSSPPKYDAQSYYTRTAGPHDEARQEAVSSPDSHKAPFTMADYHSRSLPDNYHAPQYAPPRQTGQASSPPPPVSQYLAGASNTANATHLASACSSGSDTIPVPHTVSSDIIAQITAQVRTQVIDSLRQELASTSSTSTQARQSRPAYGGSQISLDTSIPFAPAVRTPSFSQVPPQGFNLDAAGPNMSLRPPPVYCPSPTNPYQPAYTPSTPDRESDQGANAYQDRTSHGRKPSDSPPMRSVTVPETRNNLAASPPKQNCSKADSSARHGYRTAEPSADKPSRVIPIRSHSDGGEETVVEKMWQPLFDAKANPTHRMNQFLRGIALYLIDVFEPKQSLVVGPCKMRKFFDSMKVDDEILPWKGQFRLLPAHAISLLTRVEIFTLPSSQLSSLYSMLGCQHHLVPRSSFPDETPNLAALTPHGFATFMIVIIQAHPTREFDRLSATVRDWPVSNADDGKERWPKELSRRLFPRFRSEGERTKIFGALRKVGIALPPSYLSSALTRISPLPSPSPTQQSFSATAQQPPPPPPPAYPPPPQSPSAYVSPTASNTRNSRPTVPSAYMEDAANSSDDSAPSLRIERERKPYVAKEGCGKVHQDTSPTTSQPTHSFPPQDRSSSQSGSPSANRDVSLPTTSTTFPQYQVNMKSRDRGRTKPNEAGPSRSYRKRSRPGHRASPPLDNYPKTAYYDDERHYPDRERGERSDRTATIRPEDDDRSARDRDRAIDRADRERGERGERHDRKNVKYDDLQQPRTSAYNPPLGSGERRY